MKVALISPAKNSACPPFLSTVGWECREIAPISPAGAFQKVGEFLYRSSSKGVYYARIKALGKEIRRSLGRINRDLASGGSPRLKTNRAKSIVRKASLLSPSFATDILKQSNTKSPRLWSARRISWAGSSETGRRVQTPRSAKSNHGIFNYITFLRADVAKHPTILFEV